MSDPQGTEDVPKIIPWEELKKRAEREGVDIMDYVTSMNAHILNQRDEIVRLREQLAVCRSAKAQVIQQVAELEEKVRNRG
jgi:hypothetical protein